MSENTKKLDMPTTDQLQKEVDRVHYRRDFSRVMVNTIYSLVVVAAVAVLVAVLLLSKRIQDSFIAGAVKG